ncbi:hypothetical protein ACS0PU_004937 [Formica fusca]
MYTEYRIVAFGKREAMFPRRLNNIFETALEVIKRSSVIHFRDRRAISSMRRRRNEVSLARYSYRCNINGTAFPSRKRGDVTEQQRNTEEKAEFRREPESGDNLSRDYHRCPTARKIIVRV